MCQLIEEKDVTAVNLSLELERSVIQHELRDDAVIYVTEDGFYPFWINILNTRGFVGFSTHTYFKNSSTHLQRLEFCNKINCQSFMVTAYITDDEKLKIDHVLSYRDGMLRETFIRGCRQFSASIGRAITEIDPDNELIMPPGKMESEDEQNC